MTTSRKPLRGVRTLIVVKRNSAKPLHQQLYEEFRSRVLQNELQPGQLVPSTRELARDLGISRLPALEAYAQLLAEGFFETRVGSGTFVAASLQLPSTTRRPEVRRVSRESRRIGARASAVPKYERPSWAESLGPFQVGQPELREFPMDVWSRLIGRYARSMRVRGLQYGDPFGIPELRQAIASYLRSSRAVRCSAEQIMIVSGSQQALDLCARVLLDPEDRVWVEEPGYWLVRNVLNAAGCELVPVPVDGEGLDVQAGIKLARSARAAFVSPSHQYPLGVTMSAARRLQLLQWANEANAWIIEDDYDSEYRYDGIPISSLQGLDRADRVIYVGNFSKVMFPSMRLGYVVIPSDLVERFAAVRQTMDICPPHMNQAVMTEFIREGHFSRHLRRMRPLYAERRRVLVEALERELGGRCMILGDNAGMHLTIYVDGCEDQRLGANAAEQGILLSALSASYVGAAKRTGFVLGFGNSKAAQIAASVKQLRELIVRRDCKPSRATG
jgi:GntR family transcriptional regulator / MocR family aminotransferase